MQSILKDLIDQFVTGPMSEQADPLVGKGRAAMWRDSRRTMAQLPNFNGQSLSLTEPRKLYES